MTHFKFDWPQPGTQPLSSVTFTNSGDASTQAIYDAAFEEGRRAGFLEGFLVGMRGEREACIRIAIERRPKMEPEPGEVTVRVQQNTCNDIIQKIDERRCL